MDNSMSICSRDKGKIVFSDLLMTLTLNQQPKIESPVAIAARKSQNKNKKQDDL